MATNAPIIGENARLLRLIPVRAERAEYYDVADAEPGPTPRAELIVAGPPVEIGAIDIEAALRDLIQVMRRLLEWQRREMALSVSRNKITNPRVRALATLELEMRRRMRAVDHTVFDDSDPRFLAWLKRYANEDRRFRARLDFENRWIDFAEAYGPLRGELISYDFGKYATDLRSLISEQAGGTPSVDGHAELASMHQTKIAHVQAALSAVSDENVETGMPDTYTALAYAIENRKTFGVRYQTCENKRCERLFIRPRTPTPKRHCSTGCRVAANRDKRA